MADDLLQPAEAAIIRALKANGPLTSIVVKDQIYDGVVPASPTWPFTRIASTIATPFLATCLDSSAFRISLQAFAKDKVSGGIVVARARDVAMSMASKIKDALDNATLDIGQGMKLRLAWVQTTAMIDGDEAGAWMATIVMRAEVSG